MNSASATLRTLPTCLRPPPCSLFTIDRRGFATGSAAASISHRRPGDRWTYAGRAQCGSSIASGGRAHRGVVRPGEGLHHSVLARRTSAARNLGPEARCAGGSPRRSEADCFAHAGSDGRRANAPYGSVDRQDLRAAGPFDPRQRPFVERLLDAHRHAARADEQRELEARRRTIGLASVPS